MPGPSKPRLILNLRWNIFPHETCKLIKRACTFHFSLSSCLTDTCTLAWSLHRTVTTFLNVSFPSLIRPTVLVLDAMIDELYYNLKPTVTSPGFSNPSVRSQCPVLAVGRICCDSEGKLNEHSVMLESSRSQGGGCRIKLDLTKTPSFSLFPGQVRILVRQRCFSSDRIHLVGHCR